MQEQIKIFQDQMDKVLELLESSPTDSLCVQSAIDYIKSPKQKQARALATALMQCEIEGMRSQRDLLRYRMDEMFDFYKGEK